MDQSDSDSFELIPFEEHNSAEISSTAKPSIEPQNDFLVASRFELAVGENEPTLSISLDNQFQESFVEPIRKGSLRLQDWLDPEGEKSLQEVSPEQLVEQEQSICSFSSEENELPTTSVQLYTSIFTERRNQTPESQDSGKIKEIPSEPTTAEIDNDHDNNTTIVAGPNTVTVIQKQGAFYWERGFTVEITLKALSIVYDQMFSRQCFIPIFTQRIFLDWASLPPKERGNTSSQQFRILRGYLQKYTEFLCQQHFYASFWSIISRLRGEETTYASSKSTLTSTMSSLIHLDFAILIQGIRKLINTSKSQILRDTIKMKLQSLEQAQRNCLRFGLVREVKRLTEAEDYYWNVLDNIDLLLSLEATEQYCSKRLEGSPETKIRDFWLKYRGSVRQSTQMLYQTTLNGIQI